MASVSSNRASTSSSSSSSSSYSSDAGGQPLLLHHIGAGLRNRGNTCFMNAVLQCLIHTVPLVQSVRSAFPPHGKVCEGDDEKFCSLCALQDLIERCQHYFSKSIGPDLFVENMKKISPFFERYQQEDAHEFLQCLLDNLDSCFKTHGLACASSPLQDNIWRTFGGRLFSEVKCSNCGHCSETFDPILDLSLEIYDADNLEDALSSFTKVERVEDPDNKFACPGCTSQVSVEKQLKLDQVPPVLVLHLKRFKNDGEYFDKIDTHVGCPMQLDLKPYINSRDNVQLKYDLYALVVHDGSTPDSGHYYCFIRSSPKVWHKMDDSMVSRVSAEEISEEKAYILFYIRHGSSPWFSRLMRSGKRDSFQNPRNKTSPTSVLDCATSFNYTSGDSGNCVDDLVEKLTQGQLDVHVEDGSFHTPATKPKPKVDSLCEASASKPKVEGGAEVIHPPVVARSPLGSSSKELILDVFDDEVLEDEKEHILTPAAKVVRPMRNFKPCSRMQETVNRQLRQMGGSRRQALQAFMPPTLQMADAEHPLKKRRLNRELLGDNKNTGHPTLKTR